MLKDASREPFCELSTPVWREVHSLGGFECWKNGLNVCRGDVGALEEKLHANKVKRDRELF